MVRSPTTEEASPRTPCGRRDTAILVCRPDPLSFVFDLLRPPWLCASRVRRQDTHPRQTGEVTGVERQERVTVFNGLGCDPGRCSVAGASAHSA